MKVEMVPIDKLRPDPNQPRKTFNQESIAQLAETYKRHAVIVPIEIDENNMIIIGERRWRAAKLAGLKEIPCIRKSGLSAAERLARQITEEIMKEPIPYPEKVAALERLAQLEGSEKITKISRGGFSDNVLQRAELYRTAPQEMKEAVAKGKISPRAVIEIREKIKDERKQKELFERAVKRGWSARRVEREAEILKVKEQLIATRAGKKTPHDFVNAVSNCLWSVTPFLDRRFFPTAARLLPERLRDRLLRELRTIKEDYIEPAIAALQAAAET